MSAETLTIMFRGLMVSHLVPKNANNAPSAPEDMNSKQLEIGVYHAKNHTLRFQVVNEQTQVPVAVFPLDDFINTTSRNWRLEVANPLKTGVTFKQDAEGKFDRLTHQPDEDFRWIIDLEGDEFYPKGLAGDLNTAALKPVLIVPHGEFRTTETAEVTREIGDAGGFKPFGRVAANTGCNIELEGEVRLLDDSGREILRFSKAPGIYYEFVNTPPESAMDNKPGMQHHPGAEPTMDHFQMYYELLPKEIEKFGFQEVPKVEDPNVPEGGPRPQLCGKVFMSKTTTPF